MMNSSLQFRFSALLWSFSFGTLAIILTSFAVHGVDIFMLGFLAVGIAVSAWGQWQAKAWLAPIGKLKFTVDEVAQGKFNSRVTGIAESRDEIGMLCWSVNDMLDQLSVMFREQESSFSANLKPIIRSSTSTRLSTTHLSGSCCRLKNHLIKTRAPLPPTGF